MKKNLLFLFLFTSLLSRAQPGTNDSTFNTLDPGFSSGEGLNSVVYTTVVQPDGKVIIAGDFTLFNEKTMNRIARIDNNFLDTGFKIGTGFNDKVRCMALQKDGKIIVAGDFTIYNGVTRNRIARLNPDGTLDTKFNPNLGFNNDVRTIAIQSDGKIIAGGTFSKFAGVTNICIARLDTNGKLDATYNTGGGFNSAVYALHIQKDGKALVGGYFTLFNGVIAQRIARLKTNGTMDSSFAPGFGFDKEVYAISEINNNKYIVGGAFDYFNGIARKRMAMIDSTGALDTSFDSKISGNAWVYALSVQSDGNIIAAGYFTTYTGSSANSIIRLKHSGTMDTTLAIGEGFKSGTVYSTALHPDDRIVVAGSFATYNTKERNNIVRIFADGRLDASLNLLTGFNKIVRVIIKQSDGKILVGGDFRSYNGVDRSGIARLNTDGTLDTTFKPGLGIAFYNFSTGVYSMLVQKDGKIIVGGAFFSYNGIYTYNLIRLNPDGSMDTTYKTGTGAGGGTILCMVMQSDGKIIIGGNFGSYHGNMSNSIARVNTDGSRDTTFLTGKYPYSGFDGSVLALALQKDGKILVGGGFSRYRQTYFNNRIIRLNQDGAFDSTFYLGNGFGSGIYAIAIQDDEKILVGGSFTTFNTVSRIRIARLLSNGKLDSTFYPGSSGFNGTVNRILLQDDGQILVSGAFTTYNQVSRNRICRLNPNGTLDNSINFGVGFPGAVETIALQHDGKILVGGDFVSFDKIGRNRITRINNNCIRNIFTLNPKACNSYTSNGKTYSSSTTFIDSFTNHYGCDSVITTNLTINRDTSSTLTQSGCDSLKINGQRFVNSGIFFQTVASHTGCDSTITLNLTINKSSGFVITNSSCDKYTLNSKTYTASGKYTQLIQNTAGCDSLITLNLTIIKVDTGVVRTSASSLKANATGAIYQWLDCNHTTNPELPGETGQTFTAKKNGKYGVRVTQANCTKTSACFEIKLIGIEKTVGDGKIKLFPNPVKDMLTITLESSLVGSSLKISDLTGRILMGMKLDRSEFTLDLSDYTPGLYLLELYDNEKVERIRLIKE